jgi:hypothetical protein
MSPDNESKLNHRLFNQLMAADASEEEVEELYNDLKFIFENPFDRAIEVALTQHGSTYIEQNNQRLN